MRILLIKGMRWLLALMAVLSGALQAHAAIDGVTGTVFNLITRTGYISTPDGNSIFMWGFGLSGGDMQYPGPTMIVNQGDRVTVRLTNNLPVNVSILFPGQSSVIASGGVQGTLAREALPGGTVTYSFTASQPGTYTYYSGSNSALQVEMGLVGAIIVRPTTNPANQAYNHADSYFDHEHLFLITDMDPLIHELVETGRMSQVDTTTRFPVYWFINGRCGPDTMSDANVPWLPNQPYNVMPMMHPGEKILLRMVGGGADMHPFHTHGNHHRIIARDGILLESTPGAGADLAVDAFTTNVIPGSTVDALFTWTGEKLGWDVYGHKPTDPMEPGEYAPDHGKAFPVIMPNSQDLTFGPWYSGSSFLGALGALPPGEGGFNPNGGFFFMWHSHNEKELTNYDIFPGGIMTMMVVEHPSVMLMNH